MKYCKSITLLYILFAFLTCNSFGEKQQNKSADAPYNMAWVEGAQFEMGVNENEGHPGEFPKHKVEVSGFYIDKYEVTNKQFSEFVEATGYITTAERKPTWDELKSQLPPGTERFPDSIMKAGSIVFNSTKVDSYNDYTQWWKWELGANWKHPKGVNSGIESLMDHPVVHVSWFDAMSYAKWAGKDLPTEAEWVLAAMDKNFKAIYPWGNTRPNDKKPQANYFQGKFPETNLNSDGYANTAPVGSFKPNSYGVYDLGGNVWEWCKDYYHIDYFKECKEKGLVRDPQGSETSYDPMTPYMKKRITKGGSFLCNDSYCGGYKINMRMNSDPYSSQDHTGFRCVIRK